MTILPKQKILPKITPNNNLLEKIEVKHFKYLGVFLTNEVSLDTEVDARVKKASMAFGCLNKLVWYQPAIKCSTKGRLFKAVILPVLLYGSESWLPLNHHLQRHIQRMENSRLPKQLVVSKTKEGKRLHGKHKQRWHDVVNADMVSTWRIKALNRNLWRREISSKLHDLNHFKETEEKGKKDREKENEKSETDLKYPICNKICFNKTGLANHIRLSHTTNFQKTSKC